jgi:hypothetical protein
MLVLCVALWKDLSRDPLVLKRELADQVLAETVDTGVEKHDGEPFELATAPSPEDNLLTGSGNGVPAASGNGALAGAGSGRDGKD